MIDQLTIDSCANDAAAAASDRHRLTHGEECPRCGEHFIPTEIELRELDLCEGILCPECRLPFVPTHDCPVCGEEEWGVVISCGRILSVCLPCDAETAHGPAFDHGPVR